MKILSRNLFSQLFWVGVFGLGMGVLEAIVVVYLRDVYYPAGFKFPMSPVSAQMYFVELVRETATILMLLSLGFLIGKNGIQKIAYFLIAFATWDIVYYLGLKLFLNWPSSLMTWDVLFLIPLPWLGPVLAPLIVSVTMIWIGSSLLLLEDRHGQIIINTEERRLWILGTLVLFVAFIWNYSVLIVHSGYASKVLTLSQNPDFLKVVYNYIPKSFNWVLFIVGEILVVAGTIRFLFRYRGIIEYTGKELWVELNQFLRHVFHIH
ncbi:MAG: hypothetical protein JXR87_06120 [Candidatus Marinimicrobia bacterium]|nr:hypothetical protein [Candidatus Neomarinimicrobiota bacterium]